MSEWAKPSDAAAEAAVWGLIETEAKKRKDAARAWLTEQMGPDLLSVAAVANGEKVGKATFVEPEPVLKVTNAIAFHDFVEKHYPTAILTVPQVSPMFQKNLLQGLKQVGNVFVDEHGVPVPGVELVSGTSYVTVSKAKDARAKVEALLSQGGLSLDGIRAIEGADK